MTENMLNTAMGFMAGFNLGLIVAIIVVFFKVKCAMLNFYDREKITIDKLNAIPNPVPPSTVPTEVSDRLNRASELTRIQNEIMAQAQMPSQNAMHSKHKNGLVQQYKALETEKMGILHSIVKDGHDPLVTVFNSTSKQNEEVKLSFFLTQFGASGVPQKTKTDPISPLTEGEGIRKVEKDGKTFFVIDGGKKTTQ